MKFRLFRRVYCWLPRPIQFLNKTDARKAELATLDQKITAELAPKHGENDVEKDKQINTVDSPNQSDGSDKWLVAEPRYNYISVTNKDHPYSCLFGL